MKILLTGKNGQVGWELERSLMPIGDVVTLDRVAADFSKPESLRQVIRAVKPDVIINAAAYTAVDQAEGEVELAMLVNAEAPGVLAEEAAKHNALLIHYSTDYVFDGLKQGVYTEEDTPNPINIYGKSKLAGENAIRATEAEYLIFRTSWVFSSRGKNFLNTILKLAAEREVLSIVGDQIGAPTWSRLIAETTANCVLKAVQMRGNGIFNSGIYNLTARNHTSWYGFAKEIVTNSSNQPLRLMPGKIKPIKTEEYPTPAQRPLNSRMDISKLEQEFMLRMPGWEGTLKYCLD